MKKFLALFLSLLLVFSIIPTAAFATGTVAGTTINGQLDISSLTDDDSGEGWSWVASTKTLTLTSLTVTNDGNYRSAIILPDNSENDTITIVFEGDNYISGFNQTSGRAFVAGYDANASGSGNLKLTGDGSLTVTDCGWIQNGSFTDMIIDGTTIIADTVSGLTVGGTLTIQDADVTINSTGTYNALYAVEGITITKSTVTASAPNSSNAVIATQNTKSSGNTDASFVVEDSTINVTGGLGWGLWCSSYNGTSSMTVTDSDITVGSAAGVYSADALTLAGDVNILTISNRQVLLSASIDTDELGEDAVIQGYARQGNDMYYLTDYTLTSDFSVISGRTLTIPEGVILTLGDDVTLSAEVDETIVNNGTIVVSCGSSGGVASGALSSGSNAVEIRHSYGEGVVTSPTCTEGGYTTYTCACGDSYTDDETEATGHTYTVTVCEWASDYTSATLTLTCSACGDTQTVDATVASEMDSSGNTVYTATAIYNDETYTSEETVENETEAKTESENTSSDEDIISTLIRIQASYKGVQAAIEKANSLNPDDYEDFSAVTAAIESVNWNLNVLYQKQVNAYAEAIEEAIENLVLAETVDITEETIEVDEPVEAGNTDVE